MEYKPHSGGYEEKGQSVRLTFLCASAGKGFEFVSGGKVFGFTSAGKGFEFVSGGKVLGFASAGKVYGPMGVFEEVGPYSLRKSSIAPFCYGLTPRQGDISP